MTQFGIWKSCLAVQGMPSGVITYKESEGSDSTGEASYIPAPQPRHTDPEVQTCSLHDHKAPLNRLCFNKIKSTTNINKAPLNQLCLNKIKNTTNIDKAPVKYSLPKKKKKKSLLWSSSHLQTWANSVSTLDIHSLSAVDQKVGPGWLPAWIRSCK